MKKTIMVLSVFVFLMACKSEPKPVNVKYQTSLHCDGCKETISNKLNKTDGILDYDVEVSTKIVTIKYDENVTDSVKLKTIIADLGYDVEKIN